VERVVDAFKLLASSPVHLPPGTRHLQIGALLGAHPKNSEVELVAVLTAGAVLLSLINAGTSWGAALHSVTQTRPGADAA
jgi:hypothetical protein